MSRPSKIARLPRAVRDTLNVRLQEGDSGPELLTWLNAQPGVSAVLAEHFDGHPVNAQNLSEWRRGGYAVWCQQQQVFELAERLIEDQPDLDAVMSEQRLAECLNQSALLTLSRELSATWGLAEGPDRLKAVLAIVGAMDRQQRTKLNAARARREQANEDAWRPVRRAERREEEEEAPLIATPVRRSSPKPAPKPAPAPEPASADDAQIDAIWAKAMKLAAGTPAKPVAAPAPFDPKLPALQAA